jgi:hypothetical protein
MLHEVELQAVLAAFVTIFLGFIKGTVSRGAGRDEPTK